MSPLGRFLRKQASTPPRAIIFPMSKSIDHRAYSRACLRILGVLLGIWFFVSFGCGILFREWMDEHLPTVGTAPFGFWMAQQGSIICFILILMAYAVLMKRLDSKFGYAEEEDGQ
jgi:putative solute:sodium symporter small subunit